MKRALRIFVFICALLQSAYTNDIAQLLLTGKPSGHMGLYYQGMTGGAPSFVDANVSLAYQTRRLRGVALGASMWAATKLFQLNTGDFSQVKSNFVFTELYANFTNPNRISASLGRFAIDSEWIKYYTQGAALSYEDIENLKIDFIWANRSAYVTNYRMDDFYNPFGGVGSLYLSAAATLPDSPLQITPYIYAAPSDFTAFGFKVLVAVPAPSATLYGKMHFLSFVSKSDRVIDYAVTNGDGGFVWLEGGAKWSGFNVGGGVISVTENGARGIDAFGQSSYFERREGLFYNDATTLYAFLQYDLKQYIQLDSAIRHTSIGTKHIFNWEIGLVSEPQYNIELGVKVIGMINNADFTLDNSIFANDGRNYLLARVFGQVSF
ncbi:Opr family porin [uncultured Helicobacter sp.]|uniref:Opr family porin n=1 Tax=uncultured Helicobacter sp. TaxID=175537 RepID=UPI002625EB7F|nr:Opr family porin [uncultured Helicobacter sp.]